MVDVLPLSAQDVVYKYQIAMNDTNQYPPPTPDAKQLLPSSVCSIATIYR